MDALLRAIGQWQIVVACEFCLAALLAARTMGNPDHDAVAHLARLLDRASRVLENRS